MKRSRYEYDVALSYAGENEPFVRKVYRHLTVADLKVFFAPQRTGHLWGKDQREYQRIYGPASRFVVPFISEHYATKEWPRLEFRAASKEAKTRPDDFLLPVRLDGAKVRGLSPKLQYVDGRRLTPKAIARMLIEEKLGTSASRLRQEFSRKSRSQASVRLVVADDADMLALIATAPLPLGRRQLQRLDPSANWSVATLTRWRRQSLLQPGRGRLKLRPEVRRRLFTDAHTERRAHERWIALLLPLRAHSDTALALGLHYLSLGLVDDMLDVLIPVAEGLEPGIWSDFYLRVFERLEKMKRIRRARAKVRVAFLNSYALLLAGNQRYADALAQYAKLRALSRRTKNTWGEGQSYINAGVAAAQSSDERAAVAWYKKAITHARHHRDYVILGRALGNLAHFTDTGTASSLLDESERVAARGGDANGLAGTLMARGNLAARSGELVAAGGFYRRAAALGRQMDAPHLEAMALGNLGRTQVEREHPKKAIPLYRKALKIAEEERLSDQLPQIITGAAIAYAEARHYRRAEKLFDRLVIVHKSRGDHNSAVVARRDVGAMQVMQRRKSEAYGTFSAAIAEARRVGMATSVYRMQIDAASVAPSDTTAIGLLHSARRAAVRAKDFERALSCTVHITEWHLHNNDMNAALHEIAGALRSANDETRLPLLADQLLLLIDAGESERRIAAAFRRVVKAARKAGDQERLVDAHMALGDALWKRGVLNERANAYQAYVAALLPAGEVSFEAFLRVGVHAAMNLHSLCREDDRLEMLGVIEKKTLGWLRRHKVDEERYGFFLWPLRFARSILQRDDLGRTLTAEEAVLMLTEEVRRATGISMRERRSDQ